MKALLLLAASVIGWGQSQPDVLDFVRTAADALAQKNASEFMDHFDRDMPGYETLRGEIEVLLTLGDVGSAIEIVTDEGDDRGRNLTLDWVLEVQDQRVRRGVIKGRIEKKGKRWKFVGLEPIEFFRT